VANIGNKMKQGFAQAKKAYGKVGPTAPPGEWQAGGHSPKKHTGGKQMKKGC
jgi:hypothetical protein